MNVRRNLIMVNNHEVRFNISKEISEMLKKAKEDLAKGLSKSAFNRAIFILGIKEFKSKLTSGLIPSFKQHKDYMEINYED